MTPVKVLLLFSDSPYEDIQAGNAEWERVEYTYAYWLDAANAISSARCPNIVNTRYVSFVTADTEGFRAYCSRLMPRGVKI